MKNIKNQKTQPTPTIKEIFLLSLMIFVIISFLFFALIYDKATEAINLAKNHTIIDTVVVYDTIVDTFWFMQLDAYTPTDTVNIQFYSKNPLQLTKIR